MADLRTVVFLLALTFPVLTSLLSKSVSAIDNDCPTWTQPVEGSTDCECGDSVFGAVHCDKVTKHVEVNIFYCMSFSQALNRSVAGCCPYTNQGNGFVDGILYSVPNETSKLNDAVCGHLNRTGQLCGSCQEGYAPPVYSYSLACVECSDYKYNWIKYIAVAYLPLTVFYFIVIFFRVNISSPSLSVYVLISQLVGIPPVMQLMSKMDVGRGFVHGVSYHRLSSVAASVITSMYGMWNLDFFRFMYTPFCLHPNMTLFQGVALEYAIAVYPVCLVLITYAIVQLHSKYSLVVWFWTPFRRCFSYFRKEWNLSDSLVGAFGTFLLLSYMKILYTSFVILVPTSLHDMHGYVKWSLYVLYDGNLRWFGRQHLPFALFALFMSLVFNFLPLFLLCLYPCSCFQRCLNKCRLNFRLLHVLMDTIHGGYKLEPRDLRHFAVFYLVARIVNLTLFAYILYVYDYFVAVGSFFVLYAFVVVIVRPYKNTIHNILDIFMLLTFGYTTMLYGYLETVGAAKVENKSSVFMRVFAFIFGVGVVVPPLYGIGLFLYSIVPRKVLLKLKAFIKRRIKMKGEDEDEDELHDYLDVNSPLLSTSISPSDSIITPTYY